MYKIITKTPIIVSTGFDDNDDFIKAPEELLKKLNGNSFEPLESFDETLSDYIDFEASTITQDGQSFVLHYDVEQKILIAESRFFSSKLLTPDEIKEFMEEYDGQMTDGIGSGLMQELSDNHDADFEIYSFYENTQKSTFHQE